MLGRLFTLDSEVPSAFNFMEARKAAGISALAWICIVVVFYIFTTLGHYFEFKISGAMAGYPPSVSILFAPLTEELIFRGILLAVFTRRFGSWGALGATSLLFSLWHLKNIFWLEPSRLAAQMIYTGLFFGPLMAWITLKTRTVWPAVALHYLNNMSSPLKGWLSLLQ